MTLLDAIKSGKRHRRKGLQVWLGPNGFTTYTLCGVTATDWEIEGQSITITEDQYDKAIEDTYTIYGLESFEQVLKRQLGFKK